MSNFSVYFSTDPESEAKTVFAVTAEEAAERFVNEGINPLGGITVQTIVNS